MDTIGKVKSKRKSERKMSCIPIEEGDGGGQQNYEPVNEDVNMNAQRHEIANHFMQLGYDRRGRLW